MNSQGNRRANTGNALIGILAAVGIFGVISVGMSSLITDIWKAQNSSKSLSEANNLHDEIRTHLSSRQACLNTFSPLGTYTSPVSYNVTSIKNGEDPAATPAATPSTRYELNKPYGSGSIEIATIKIDYPNPTNTPIDLEEAVVSISYRPKGKVLGPEVLKAREILLAVKRNGSNIMIDCISKAKMTDGIWRRLTSDPSKIFYSEGYVGIGTTTPEANLHVNNAILLKGSGGPLVRFSNSDGGANQKNSQIQGLVDGLAIGTNDDSWNWQQPATYAIFVSRNGNVGIGTASPTQKLDVNGSARVVQDLTVGGAYYYSDRRLKRDITTIKGLDSILKLRGVRFSWEKSGKQDVGLVAQEVEEVFPELVSSDRVSGMKSVKYANLVAPLVEATKELHETCEASAHAAKTLRDENEILKARMAILEKKVELLSQSKSESRDESR